MVDFLGAIDTEHDSNQNLIEKQEIYSTHLTWDEIQLGLSKGELFRGKLFADRNVPENAKILNRDYGLQI